MLKVEKTMNYLKGNFFLISILLLILMWGCNSDRQSMSQAPNQIKNISHNYNDNKPKYGVVSLKAVPTLTISSESIPKSNRKNIPFFYTVRKDSKDNFYFMDYHSVSMPFVSPKLQMAKRIKQTKNKHLSD